MKLRAFLKLYFGLQNGRACPLREGSNRRALGRCCARGPRNLYFPFRRIGAHLPKPPLMQSLDEFLRPFLLHILLKGSPPKATAAA